MKRLYWILFILLVAGNAIIYQELLAPPVLKVRVLSVSKGDATLVQTPSGKSLLIDVGGDASIVRALGSALPFWQRSIDAVIITNQAAGSAGGLSEVQSRYHIINLIHLTTTEEHVSLGDGASADILASPKGLLALHIAYGTTTITVSSSTPVGVYISNGKTIK